MCCKPRSLELDSKDVAAIIEAGGTFEILITARKNRTDVLVRLMVCIVAYDLVLVPSPDGDLLPLECLLGSSICGSSLPLEHCVGFLRKSAS